MTISDYPSVTTKQQSITAAATTVATSDGCQAPVYAILLWSGPHKAQHLPVLHWRGPVSQAYEVVVALLLGALLLVGEGVEPGSRPHAGAAARLTLPLLHPANYTPFSLHFA